ncbi:MAG TPA: class I SAM-dependent methyltransferase, partial [Salinimicrobium sp.]|nr:class I SAM-dependent methyltransferase [Salinimicrobium sp.]
LKAYIKFLWRSTNQHGVHSPFVFDLVTKCFYTRKKHPSFLIIKNYRRRLFKNQKTIKVSDFGAGSRVFSSNERKISAVAKNAGISLKRSQILNKMIPFLNIENALELGTSVGMGTAAMAAGNNVHVTTLEGCPETASVAQENFDFFNLKNIDLEIGNFDDLLPNMVKEKWDLIYFDGNHDKAATLKYFEELLPTVHNDSVFIFDDIHWSDAMEEAWEEIKNNPKVTVSIDTFFWGIVFFRKEQAKEHFTIRL